TALTSGGGRIFGSIAVSAARSLAKRTTFRWRVAKRVRKRVGFPCRWKSYRAWLKSITADELELPVEEVQAALAKRLDVTLSASSDEWSASDDHLSRALRLVELTFPAIASSLGADEAAGLSESWARSRNSEVRRNLRQLVGPGAAMSTDDLQIVLRRESVA